LERLVQSFGAAGAKIKGKSDNGSGTSGIFLSHAFLDFCVIVK